jgi:hypothetical protein
MDDEPKIAGDVTLSMAIEALEKLSWRLNGLVYGETPECVEKEPTVRPADKLTSARNRIQDVNSRLRGIADRLEIIGK